MFIMDIQAMVLFVSITIILLETIESLNYTKDK